MTKYRLWFALLATLLTLTGAAFTGARASAAPSASGACAPLYVLGVPGTGETTSTGSTKLDSGMLGAITRPLSSLAGSLTTDVAVPYDAGFGGAVKGGDEPYSQSVTQGAIRLTNTIKQTAQKCSDAQFGILGYSQGAQVVSMVAKAIGQGSGPVDASRVAGVALLGNPVRQAGAPTFDGGGDKPQSPSGDDSGSLAKLPAYSAPTPTGAGIGPTADISGDYGQLAGRVGDFCATGDLACDAPANSPLMHVVTNIAGSSKLDQKDPVGTLATLATALGSTAIKTGFDVINQDVSGGSLEDLSYTPSQPLSTRLAAASDPRSPMPNVNDSINALIKVGTIGFNAVQTVAKSVFTPDTIAQVAAVGLANPLAALGVLVAKVPAALVELVPPSTVSRWTDEAFQAVQTEVTANSDLFNLTNLVSYWNAGQTHTSYAKATTASVPSAAMYIAQWFAALAHDAAGQRSFSPYRSDGVLNYDTKSESGSSSVFTPSVEMPSTTTTTSSSSGSDASIGDGSSFNPGGDIVAGTPTTTTSAVPSTSTPTQGK